MSNKFKFREWISLTPSGHLLQVINSENDLFKIVILGGRFLDK